MTRHYKQVVKRKYGQYLQWSAFFRIFFFLFKFSLLRKNNEKMMHIEKYTIILLQFAKDCMSISSKLRPQEEVENDPSKKNKTHKKNP